MRWEMLLAAISIVLLDQANVVAALREIKPGTCRIEFIRRWKWGLMERNLYEREAGSQCFETPLFDDRVSLSHFVDSLKNASLCWYWCSERQYEPEAEFADWNLPKSRSLTLLSSDTRELLVRDLSEEDIDMRRRSVTLIGVAEGTSFRSATSLEAEIQAFLSGENSTIEIVVDQINDMKTHYVFFPRNPSDAVRGLLLNWGLLGERPTSSYPYSRLRTAQLETGVDRLVDMAFP